MHDGINRADILSCFLYMRVYSTEPPEEEHLLLVFFVVIIETFVILIVLADAGINDFNGNSTLVIVGAYSVDKEYRLIMILMNLN